MATSCVSTYPRLFFAREGSNGANRDKREGIRERGSKMLSPFLRRLISGWNVRGVTR